LTHLLVVQHPDWSLPKVTEPLDLDIALQWKDEFDSIDCPDLQVDVVCAHEPDRVFIEIDIERMFHDG
jgi:hypothetical protein